MTNYADTMSSEYEVNERKTLRRGDVFRVSGGPYYVNERGDATSMAARGPMVFMRYCTRGEQQWIEAHSTREGTMVILSLTERPSILPGSLVTRPYTIGSKAREATRARIARRISSVDARRAAERPVRKPKAKAAPEPATLAQRAQKTLDEIFAKNAQK